MAKSVVGLKTINMMGIDTYESQTSTTPEELYAVSGWGVGLPSNYYSALTLGASGTTYTATQSGYFLLSMQSSGASQYIDMINTESRYEERKYAVASGQTIVVACPAKKGDTITITYNTGGVLNNFVFIVAEGN